MYLLRVVVPQQPQVLLPIAKIPLFPSVKQHDDVVANNPNPLADALPLVDNKGILNSFMQIWFVTQRL